MSGTVRNSTIIILSGAQKSTNTEKSELKTVTHAGHFGSVHIYGGILFSKRRYRSPSK